MFVSNNSKISKLNAIQTLALVGKKLILICEKFPAAREMVGLVVGWGFIGHGRPRM